MPTPNDAPHVPVLLRPLIRAVSPVSGVWVDGTFGAGGYARALLEAGAERVIGIDRDPSVFALAAAWAAAQGDRLRLVEGTFSELDSLAGMPLDGVVLDLGVSSMQLDQPERGFSFLRDGPLDMRMSAEGASAADLLNTASEAEIADILYHYGEERASRRIIAHQRSGAGGRALPAARQTGAKPCRDPHISGCPDLGQRRVRPADRGAGSRRARAQARWLAGRRQFSFARRPGGEALFSGAIRCRGAGQPPRSGARRGGARVYPCVQGDRG